MKAHELAQILLAGPDVRVVTITACCGCSAPRSDDRPLHVEYEDDTAFVTDEDVAS